LLSKQNARKNSGNYATECTDISEHLLHVHLESFFEQAGW